MATIVDESVIKDLIENRGIDPSDTPAGQHLGPVVRIVEYKTPEGRKNWGVVYLIEARMGLLFRYDNETEYVREPRVLWKHPELPSARVVPFTGR